MKPTERVGTEKRWNSHEEAMLLTRLLLLLCSEQSLHGKVLEGGRLCFCLRGGVDELVM
jgi:hypothetical protein